MIFLADFSVIKPDPGLFIWSCIIFALFWIIIGRFAFRPIAQALKKREDDIQGALDESVRTRQEMAKLKADNEALLAQAREERSQMLKEAKETRDGMIKEAKEGAKQEANKILAQAKIEIENQKKQAINEVKNQAGMMAIEITERLLKEQLKDRESQKRLVSNLVNDLKLS
ncbi:MAG: F0F1 ATP synthase subunit B [Saprospiraceae bacterium]|nr:F0F1 ATP synthase subunit B [Saprospiraceae bacterium]